ncbi:hypothetical protein MMYC01_205440 [Madurella mycetomatis]|uniref:Uncharacterized protein n=1 Tax=Madurella mycetomatis TaxID=100816 RepID=A0A175W3L1_9PEZI|nr:hypothetical protein MMYC01_205440 [Madurella mycetomatis]
MSNHPVADLLAPFNAWILEDTHLRKATHVEDAYTKQDSCATAPATHVKAPGAEKLGRKLTTHEEAAIDLAIATSREQERCYQAMLEQKRRDVEYLKSTRLTEEVLEREREAALRRAQALEEFLCTTRRERAMKEQVVREQAVREAEIKLEIQSNKDREREREKELAALREKTANLMREMEDVAVAKAVKDSIATEKVRKMVEEKMRMLREREQAADIWQAERLKQFQKEAWVNGATRQTPKPIQHNYTNGREMGEFPPRPENRLRDMRLGMDTHWFRHRERQFDVNCLVKDEVAVWCD